MAKLPHAPEPGAHAKPVISRRQASGWLGGLVGFGALPLGLTAPSGAAAQAGGVSPPKPWPKGQATPPLSLPLHDGGTWRLDQQRGKVVVLNFWASWCEPCRAEMPTLELLAERHAKAGLEVVAVNFRETDGALKRFLDQQPVSLPVARDSDGAAAKAWGVRVFPTTVVVKRDGQAAFSVIGEADWNAEPTRGWVAALL
jgi:thiol-disulfide isomerase/thioredoxin